MAGLRHTYVTIMGIILISYGVILNMLGAIASFIHPGSYHHGAMGTPMWCGLAFIIFGAVNIATGREKKRHKRGIQLVMPITSILTVIVSTLCIALISWSMSASGILTNHHVTQLIVTSQQNTTFVDGNLQLALIPVYSTIISCSTILLLMGLLSLCVECVGMVNQARVRSESHSDKRWDERDQIRRTYPIVEDQPQYHHGDAVGEVMYGSTPAVMPSAQVVKTIERPTFHHQMDQNDGKHQHLRHINRPQHDNTYHPDHTRQSGHNHHSGHALESGHTNHTGHTHQRGHVHQARNEDGQSKHVILNDRDQTNRQYPYQPNSAPNLREVERAERRPNPYFYL